MTRPINTQIVVGCQRHLAIGVSGTAKINAHVATIDTTAVEIAKIIPAG